MVIILDQYTPTEEFINVLTKSFTKQLEQKSFISSIAANYKVRDGLSLGGRLVQYQASSVADSFYPYKNQDVIMLSTEYSF